MRKSSRQFRFERLEARCLFAALSVGDPQASVVLENAASIEVSEVEGLRGAALEITFDHRRLQVDPRDVRAGTAWGGKGMSIANVDNEEGTINVFVYSVRETENGQGSIVEIDFRRLDNEHGGVSSLVDVNRLRVNDGDVSLSETGSGDMKLQGNQSPPKLSLQFNISPEGESAAAADLEAAYVPQPHFAEIDVESQLETVKESVGGNDDIELSRREVEGGPLEANKRIELLTSNFCRPGDIEQRQLHFAHDDGVARVAKFIGPIYPPVGQEAIPYAPPMFSLSVEPGLTPSMFDTRVLAVQSSDRISDFSVTDSSHLHWKATLNSDVESAGTGFEKLETLDQLFEDIAFQSELSALLFDPDGGIG